MFVSCWQIDLQVVYENMTSMVEPVKVKVTGLFDEMKALGETLKTVADRILQAAQVCSLRIWVFILDGLFITVIYIYTSHWKETGGTVSRGS